MNRTLVWTLMLDTVLGYGSEPISPACLHFGAVSQHWSEKDSETLWTGRYTNGDYGFSVLLSPGVVAHGAHLPSPNHGYLVPLPNFGKKTFSSYETETRYIWVDAHYDASDGQFEQSLAAGPENDKLSVSNRRHATLGGHPAMEAIVEKTTADGQAIDDSIVALRCGIVYTFSLHTLSVDHVVDERQFQRLRHGFRWLSLPAREYRAS